LICDGAAIIGRGLVGVQACVARKKAIQIEIAIAIETGEETDGHIRHV
jgi:hypothetical protein